MSEGPDPTIEFGKAPPKDASATVALPEISEQSAARSSVLALTFLVVAAGAFLIGIAAAALSRADPEGAIVASQRVGQAGGTVRFQGGEIRIPSGALSTPQRIVVRRTVVDDRVRVRPPGRAFQVYDPGELVAYVFEPADLEFIRPVTILFRLGARDGDAATFARVRETTLLLGGEVDAARRTVTVQVPNFRFDRGLPVEDNRG